MLVSFHAANPWQMALNIFSILCGALIIAFVITVVLRIIWMLFQGALFSHRNRMDFIMNEKIVDKVTNGTIDINAIFDKYRDVGETQSMFKSLNENTKHDSLELLRDTYLNYMDEDANFQNKMALAMLYRFKDGYQLKHPNFKNTVLIFERLDTTPALWNDLHEKYTRKYLVVQEVLPQIGTSDIEYHTATLNVTSDFSDELPKSYVSILDDLHNAQRRATSATNIY